MVGICVLDEKLEPLYWGTINLSKFDTMIEKYHFLWDEIEKVLQLVKLNECENDCILNVIEDRLGGFSGGMTTQNTLMKLASINAVATFIISKLQSGQKIMHLAPVTVKSLVGLKVPKGGDKKQEAIKIASKVKGFPLEFKKSNKKHMEKQNFKPTPKTGVDDMADAYLLAFAGYKKWNMTEK